MVKGNQKYMARISKDYENIDSRLIANQNKTKQVFPVVSIDKRKALFPSSFKLGWLGMVQNN
jgi:hypothetical protein